MISSYQTLKKAIEKVGVKMIAPELNISTALIYKWCEENSELPDGSKNSGALNPLDRIEKIYKLTQDDDIINWLCQSAGGFFVRNPDPVKTEMNIGVLQNIQKFVQEFSETLDTILQSYNDDKKISKDDAEKIRKEWEDLKRTGETFAIACESRLFE